MASKTPLPRGNALKIFGKSLLDKAMIPRSSIGCCLLALGLAACQQRPEVPKQPPVAEQPATAPTPRRVVDDAWIAQLRDPDPKIRETAFVEILREDDDAIRPHAKRLESLLHDDNKEVRHRGIQIMSRVFGNSEKSLLPALCWAIKEKDQRSATAAALGKFGAEAKEAVPLLVDAFKDADLDTRREIASATFQIDKNEGGLLLVEVVMDPRSPINQGNRAEARANIVFETFRMVRQNSQAVKKLVPGLIECICDENTRYQYGATVLPMLSMIGRDAKQAVPILEACRVGVISIGYNDQIPLAGFRDTIPRPQSTANIRVNVVWDDPKIAEAFFVQKNYKRCPSNSALGGGDGYFLLNEMLDTAIKDIGPPDVAQLREALKDPRDYVQVGAAFALAKIDVEDRKAAASVLTKIVLESQLSYLRFQAVDALGAIGPDAAEAVGVLTAMLDNPNVPLRRAAFDALKKINRKKKE